MIFEIVFNVKQYRVSLRLNCGPIRVSIEPGGTLFFALTLEEAYQKIQERIDNVFQN